MRAFECSNGSLQRVIHEDDIAPALASGDRENAARVLALAIGESIAFPVSGATYTRIADDTPKMTRIVCSRGSNCKYCGSGSAKLCDYPVTRNGKPGTCDVPMCRTCTTSGGKGIDYCRPHANLMKTGANAR